MNTTECGGYTKVAVLPNGRCRHYYSQYLSGDIGLDELCHLLSGVGCELSEIVGYPDHTAFSVEFRGEYLGVLVFYTN